MSDSPDTVRAQWGVRIRARPATWRHTMGDKGGKKDKEKMKQQQVKKQAQDTQKKDDKARPKTP